LFYENKQKKNIEIFFCTSAQVNEATGNAVRPLSLFPSRQKQFFFRFSTFERKRKNGWTGRSSHRNSPLIVNWVPASKSRARWNDEEREREWERTKKRERGRKKERERGQSNRFSPIRFDSPQ
jgi:hypothetical protein